MPSSAARFLLDSSNSLACLSREHADGWGVGRYEAGVPVLEKGTEAAHRDPRYTEASRRAVSTCVLGHIRRISVGKLSVENSHPFQHAGWLFAHNGTVHHFDRVREQVESLISPDLRTHLRGTTDSERCFYLFLTHLRAETSDSALPLERMALALGHTVADLRCVPDPEAGRTHALTFLVTDGEHLVGMRSGEKELWYSTHRRDEPEPTAARYFTVASEPLDDLEAWRPLEDGWAIGVDGSLRPRLLQLGALAAPAAA